MPDLKVVPIWDNPVSLTDIPGMLRRLADQIESGEVECQGSAFCLLPKESDWPAVYGWGDVLGKNEPIVQFELARTWLVNNLVTRK